MEVTRGYKSIVGCSVIHMMGGGIHRGRVDADVVRACALESNVVQ